MDAKRDYEKSHPWIRFQVDLRGASVRLWILLGESQSKCTHIAGVPLRPATAKELHQIYLAKGAQATTAIEGNTLTEEQVLRHLEGKKELPPSQQYLATEIDNVIAACNNLFDRVLRGQLEKLTPELIGELNSRVLKDLTLREGVVPGRVRDYSVGVGRYRAAPAKDCTYLLGRLCEWLEGPDFAAPDGMEIVYGVLQAILAHLYLAWIHPFGDGNGRTARLVEFYLLVRAGVPSPAAQLLSNHYNATRSQYYRELDQASGSGGDVLPFLGYAVQGLVDGLRAQLDVVRAQQWLVAWENYVEELFRARSTAADCRRKQLALDLSTRDSPVPIEDISHISPRLAASYATKTQKTLMRDLNELARMQLVEKRAGGYAAMTEQILAFLPARAAGRGASSPGTSDRR